MKCTISSENENLSGTVYEDNRLSGGMSWESTLGYYTAINEGGTGKLGGLHSAKIAMYRMNFGPIEKLQNSGDWSTTASILCEGAWRVTSASVDFRLICANTMHKLAPGVLR